MKQKPFLSQSPIPRETLCKYSATRFLFESLRLRFNQGLPLVLLVIGMALPAWGQAPGVFWTKSIGAQLFAVDSQTNVYANTGGTVITLSGDGVPLQTISICPRPGLAQRDSDGNYYFAGVLPSHLAPSALGLAFGTQDFGGVVLSNLAVFLTKYSPAGNLLWATNFGPNYVRDGISVTDLVQDPDGNVLVGYTWNMTTWDYIPVATKIGHGGSLLWSAVLPKESVLANGGRVRLTAETGGNGLALTYAGRDPYSVVLSRFDVNGNLTTVANWPPSHSIEKLAPRTIVNSVGELYNAEDRPNNGVQLTKRQASGSVIWRFYTGGVAQRVVGRDQFDGVHVATDSGQLARYDADGNASWSINLPATCEDLIMDAQGNRFLALAGGTVARLGGESLVVPLITAPPQGQTVLSGSNVVFVVGTTGTTPLRYYWRFLGTNIPNATNSNLILANVNPAQAGDYQVVVSNIVGSVTSAPALLRIKNVAVFAGDQLLTNGTYVFVSPPALTVRSAFAGGSVFYTLDGSAPSFAGTHYTGAFTLAQSATVRAIGYSSDFLQSEAADPVNAIILAQHQLSTSTSTGGSVQLNPPGGIYNTTNVVTATAVVAAGNAFLYWLGDATGASPSINVSMERDKTIRAVFGTTLATTVAGGGQIQRSSPGTLYPYGSVVRMTAVPDPGNYFGFWGNAASGNTNPLYFTISGPTQTVSSIFGATPSGQAALTVQIAGRGHVTSNPSANVHPLNQTVTLTAIPDGGQSFLNWSGDASGTQNPLGISMTQSKVITANFTDRPTLSASRPGLEGLTADGFRLTLLSDPSSVWQVMGSTNLTTWESLGWITNSFGEVQFMDPGAANAQQKAYKAGQ